MNLERKCLPLLTAEKSKLSEKQWAIITNILPYKRSRAFAGTSAIKFLNEIEKRLELQISKLMCDKTRIGLIDTILTAIRRLRQEKSYGPWSPWIPWKDYLILAALKYGARLTDANITNLVDNENRNLILGLGELIENICVVGRLDVYRGAKIVLDYYSNLIKISACFKDVQALNTIKFHEKRAPGSPLNPILGIKTLPSISNEIVEMALENRWLVVLNSKVNENGETLVDIYSFKIFPPFKKEKIFLIDMLNTSILGYYTSVRPELEEKLGVTLEEFMIFLYCFGVMILLHLDVSLLDSGVIQYSKQEFIEFIEEIARKNMYFARFVIPPERHERYIKESPLTLSKSDIADIVRVLWRISPSKKRVLEFARQHNLNLNDVLNKKELGLKRRRRPKGKIIEKPLEPIQINWKETIETLMESGLVSLSYDDVMERKSLSDTKYYLFIAPNHTVVVPLSTLRGFFFDLSLFLENFAHDLERGGKLGERKGRYFERIIESTLRSQNHKVYTKIRQDRTDVVVGVPPYLFTLECKCSSWTNKVLTGKSLRARYNKDIKEWLKQAEDDARWLAVKGNAAQIIKDDKELQKYTWIVPVVITLYPEYLFNISDDYMLSSTIPRICTINEFSLFLKKGKLKDLEKKRYLLELH
jgi:hypothetical protein